MIAGRELSDDRCFRTDGRMMTACAIASRGRRSRVASCWNRGATRPIGIDVADLVANWHGAFSHRFWKEYAQRYEVRHKNSCHLAVRLLPMC